MPRLDAPLLARFRPLAWLGACFLAFSLLTRLALLVAYFDDSDVYVFDEWAADQDPEFREFFAGQYVQLPLAKGDAEAISQALCAAANAPDLDGVRAKLDDPAQQVAVDALQRARWGDGDIASAIAALRAAFKRGPRWKAATAKAKELLPPLYPE